MPEENPQIQQVDVPAALERSEVPAPSIVERPNVPASAILDDDDPKDPTEFLNQQVDKIKGQQPKRTADLPPRDGAGRFTKADEKAEEKAEKPTAPEPQAPDPNPATPTAPTPPAKIKIGDKEYTQEELAALLKKAEQPEPSAKPVEPQPAQPTAPQQPQTPAPTPEQIAKAEEEFTAQLVEKHAANIGVDAVSLEQILMGGEEGAAALTKLLQNVVARTILETRKNVYPELRERFEEVVQAITPLQQNYEMLERHATEQAFLSQYPEYADDLDTPRQVAEALLQRYPNEVRQMTREQFITEVERQTNLIKERSFKQWNPQFQGTWKDYVKAQKAQKAAPETTAPPAAPTPSPAPTPPPPAKPTVKPPGANSPGGSAAAGTLNWQKAVAGSLRE